MVQQKETIRRVVDILIKILWSQASPTNLISSYVWPEKWKPTRYFCSVSYYHYCDPKVKFSRSKSIYCVFIWLLCKKIINNKIKQKRQWASLFQTIFHKTLSREQWPLCKVSYFKMMWCVRWERNYHSLSNNTDRSLRIIKVLRYLFIEFSTVIRDLTRSKS